MNEWHSIGHFGSDVNMAFEGLYDNRGVTSEAWRVAIDMDSSTNFGTLRFDLWV
jgi:hypothetical protein